MRILRCLMDFALFPLLFGLLSSLLVLTLTNAFSGSETLIGILAGTGVSVGKLLLALCSGQKLRLIFHALESGIFYGALFMLLCALGCSAVGAFWILFVPFALLSYPLYRMLNYGRCPRRIRVRS